MSCDTIEKWIFQGACGEIHKYVKQLSLWKVYYFVGLDLEIGQAIAFLYIRAWWLKTRLLINSIHVTARSKSGDIIYELAFSQCTSNIGYYQIIQVRQVKYFYFLQLSYKCRKIPTCYCVVFSLGGYFILSFES